MLGLLLVLVMQAGSAQAASTGRHVIPAGHEQDLLRLLRPFSMTSKDPEGWRLGNVSIQGSKVRLELLGVSGGRVHCTLRHPQAAPSGERTRSFAIVRGVQRGEGAEAAFRRLVEALGKNDDGAWLSRVWRPSSLVKDDPPGTRDDAPWHASRRTQWFLLGLCLALLVVSLLLALRGAGASHAVLFATETTPRKPSALARFSTRGRRLILLSVAGGVFLGLWFLVPSAPLYEDTVRDVLMARDCIERGCGEGAVSGFLTLRHHVGWSALLALFISMGVPLEHLHLVALAMHALAVTLMFLTACRLLELGSAALAALLFLGVSLSASEFPLLWHPSLLPLGLALLFAGLVSTALDGRWRGCLLGGIGVGVTMEAHLTGWLLLPLVGVAVLAMARQPLRDLLGYAGTAVGVVVLVSFPSLAANAEILAGRAPRTAMILLPLTLLLLVGLGLVWRRFAWRHVPRHRVFHGLVLLAAVFPVMLLLGQCLFGYAAIARHVVPLALPLAILLPWLISATFGYLDFSSLQRRLAQGLTAAVLVGYYGGVWGNHLWWRGIASQPVRYPPYRLTEVARLARHLDSVGWHHGDRLRHLRGPRSQDLSAGVLLWATDPTVPRSASRSDLRVLRVPKARRPTSLPEGWTLLPLGAHADLLVSEIDPWARVTLLSVCSPARPSPRGDQGCHAVTSKHWARFGGTWRLVRFAQGSLASLEVPRAATLPAVHFLRVPLRVSGRDPHRHLELLPEGRQEGSAAWSIAAVEGSIAEWSPKSHCLRLLGGSRERKGTLVLRTEIPSSTPLRLPQVLETRPGESSIRRLLAPRHGPAEAHCGR